tara:strand:+ start:66 stop:665 length:600 start_codon:yes stop_codon:yes gene_type:complete
MVIIGLGTGRCGTVSLSKLIDKQEGARCSHEGVRLPWVVSEGRFNKAYNKIVQGYGDFIEEQKSTVFKRLSFVGDVSFYNLPYYNLFLERDPETKFIILKRDRDSVIKSYLKKTRGSNHWQKGLAKKNVWDECFPKFEAKDKADAIGMYYDKYYSMAEDIPNAFHMNTEDLNDSDKCMDMLAFCGFSNPILKSFWANRG